MKFLTTLLTIIAFANASVAELIPADRLTDWTPGTKTGVIGGVWQYLPGGASERTHTGTNDTDEDAGTISGDHINVALPPYSADTTGATNAGTAIQAAIDDAGTDQVVYMPAGTYRLETGLVLNGGFNGSTLRGAGRTLTTLDSRGGAIFVGSGAGASPPDYVPVMVTAGKTKGSTTLTLESAGELWQSDLTVGKTIVLYAKHDYTVPQFQVYGVDTDNNNGFSCVNQIVRITAKNVINATTMEVTIDPPLLEDDGGGAGDLFVWRNTFQADNIGLEDFTITTDNNPGLYSAINMSSCFNSWLYNVASYHQGNYSVSMVLSLRCEIRRSIISGPSNTGNNSAGVLFFGHHCLIEDNVIRNAFPVIEMNGGSAGNVWSYNYDPSLGMWNTNHGPHNRLNILEGNAIAATMSDGYFGGDETLTIYKNYLTTEYGINQKRFNRKTTTIGNNTAYGGFNGGNVGTPNIGNGSWVGEAELSTGNLWNTWFMPVTLTTRTSDTVGIITLPEGKVLAEIPLNGAAGQRPVNVLRWGVSNSVTAFIDNTEHSTNTVDIAVTAGVLPAEGTVMTYFGGAGEYQERDLDVANTWISKGNYNRDTATTEDTGGDTMPPSLIYNSKPAWWPAEMDWPPFDPYDGVATADVERLPAAYRYINGDDPPPGSKRGKINGKRLRLNGKIIKLN